VLIIFHSSEDKLYFHSACWAVGGIKTERVANVLPRTFIIKPKPEPRFGVFRFLLSPFRKRWSHYRFDDDEGRKHT
jgi:hypothetical protein